MPEELTQEQIEQNKEESLRNRAAADKQAEEFGHNDPSTDFVCDSCQQAVTCQHGMSGQWHWAVNSATSVYAGSNPAASTTWWVQCNGRTSDCDSDSSGSFPDSHPMAPW